VNPVIQDLGPCPCGHDRCDVWGTKLTRQGFLVGCKSPQAQGKRNRKKGQAAQRRMHQRLGGEGWTPTNEESARPYTVEVQVMPESKTGGQIPTSFDKFIATEWFRRALSQSSRAVPVGSGVLPAVVIRGDWCLVDIRGRKVTQNGLS
jgi:hypothetical protein